MSFNAQPFAGRASGADSSYALGAMRQLIIRPAHISEQKALEALQWRASLNNPGDRDALLAHQDAIELPLQQIEEGGVFVAEVAGSVK